MKLRKTNKKMASHVDNLNDHRMIDEEDKSIGSGSQGDQQPLSQGEIDLKEGGLDSDDDPQVVRQKAQKNQSFWSCC